MGFTILRLQAESLRDLFRGLSSSSKESDINFYKSMIEKTFVAMEEEISRLSKKGGNIDGQSEKDAS